MTASREGMALEVRGLCKSYGSGSAAVEVLSGLDLDLKQGAFEAIMGPSGSGKSTLLHLLGGLLTADSGEIKIGGVAINGMRDEEVTRFRRRRIGLIFQDFNLIPTLNVEENIVLPLLLDRERPDSERVEGLMERLKLRERSRHLPSMLSGGERQRVAIARALITKPEVVLADEPTGNLDSPAGRSFCELLHQMNREEGCTILLVSHDPVVAATAQRVHLLKDGKFAGSFATDNDAVTVSNLYLKTMQS